MKSIYLYDNLKQKKGSRCCEPMVEMAGIEPASYNINANRLHV